MKRRAIDRYNRCSHRRTGNSRQNFSQIFEVARGTIRTSARRGDDGGRWLEPEVRADFLERTGVAFEKTGDGFRCLGGFARHVAHDFTPGCNGEFGDEIIAVAAIMGAGEFDNAAIGQIGNALDEQCRAAVRQIEEFGFLRGQCRCMQALQARAPA